jgi:DNA-binding NarL/FixJ family response regulator
MTRLLLVDDHEIVRAGLKQLLAESKDFTVAGEAGSGVDAVKRVNDLDWDAVLLDISMPDMNGIDALKEIKRRKPALPVLILTMHPEEHYAINAIRAGASGYLRKDCSPEDLINAIRTIASGRRYFSPSLVSQLAAGTDAIARDSRHSHLSERELQIFCRLARGQTVSEIAAELLLSGKTISTYRARIFDKMGLKTNADLTYYAIKHGLIQ